ncbi:hypothetical protein HYALB_00011030 [Hymenoscyphus albidus]|uniref:Rhodopsin domain-containing protein n=1 Tax=Hymenoscyphus albidus TaxID=595503 RepID=A0A9N9LUS7_9HELO|nr:hypothetical protein HYALB_00011030 [Hymenoscyphus albidus]
MDIGNEMLKSTEANHMSHLNTATFDSIYSLPYPSGFTFIPIIVNSRKLAPENTTRTPSRKENYNINEPYTITVETQLGRIMDPTPVNAAPQVTQTAPVHGSQALPGFELPDENKDARIFGPVLSTGLLALVIICMRCYVRFKVLRTSWWDDYFIIGAMFLALCGMGLHIAENMMGFGHHTYYIYAKHGGQKGLKLGLELGLASQFVWIIAIMLVKLSVGMFLLRWTRMTNWQSYKVFIYFVMTFIFAYTFIVIGALLSQCTPIVYVKNGIVTGSCYAKHASAVFAYMQAVCNVITDFAFAFLPITLLFKLKMSKKHKVALVVVIILGILASVCSAVRLKFLEAYEPGDDYEAARKHSNAPDGRFILLTSQSFLFSSLFHQQANSYPLFSWTGVDLVIWVMVECHLAMIAASIPTLRPIFKYFVAVPLKSARTTRTRRHFAYTTRIELDNNPRRRSMRSNGSYRSIGRSMDRSETRSITRSANRSRCFYSTGGSRYEAVVTSRDRQLKDEKTSLCELTDEDAAYHYPRHLDGTVDVGVIAVHTELIFTVEDRDEWEDVERARSLGRSCAHGKY